VAPDRSLLALLAVGSCQLQLWHAWVLHMQACHRCAGWYDVDVGKQAWPGH
jgi:hypothetical protein